MFGRIADSPSKSLLAGTVSFVAGVVAHAFDERAWGDGPAFLAGTVVCAVAAIGARRAPRLVAVCAALFFFGLWRYESVLAQRHSPGPPPAGQASYKGTLRDEPARKIDGTAYTVDRVFVLDDGRWRETGAAVEVRGGMIATAEYGDVVEWRCAASPVRDPLSPKNIDWRCRSWSDVRVVGHSRAGPAKRLLIAARQRLRRAARLLPEPESSLLLGLLIGDTDGIPMDMREDFRRTGTAHVLAVSGYNVARVIGIVLFFSSLAVPARRRAAAVTAVAVLGFVILAGAEASVVRAGIMGGAGLMARGLGRKYSGTNALMVAAAAMLALQPAALRHDIGFQLSFAAVWGLHALGPPFEKGIRFLPDAAGLRRTLAETLAATLATLPIILAAFGVLPLASPVANVIILPTIPWAMGAGAVAMTVGAVHPLLGMLPAAAATLLLRFDAGVVVAFSALPLTAEFVVTPAIAALLYGWILLLWYALSRRVAF
jgi:competence protein ComEC